MISNGKIEISLGGVAKFFGVVVAGSGLLTALTALVFMLPGFNAYTMDRQVDLVQGSPETTVIVDVQETPGFVLDIFEDAKTTRYIRNGRNAWYAYETGRPVSSIKDELERAYKGFLLRQKADLVLAAVQMQPQTQEVEVAAPAVETNPVDAIIEIIGGLDDEVTPEVTEDTND